MALAFVGIGPAQADAASKFRSTPTPTISGTAKVGSTLKVKAGTWKPSATVKVQWRRDGKKIKGATGFEYKPTAADEGKKISVTVTGKRWGYTSVSKTSKKTKKVAAGTLKAKTPKVIGHFEVGYTASFAWEHWRPGGIKMTFQWLRDGKAIKGATKKDYTFTSADHGKKVSLKVTGTKKGYKAVSKTSKATTVKAGRIQKGQVELESPALAVRVGDTLTASSWSWSPSNLTLSYQWLRDGEAIPGATAKSYLVSAADAGAKVSVKVTGAKAGYVSQHVTSGSVSVSRPGDVPLRTIEDYAVVNCMIQELDVEADGLLTREQIEDVTSLDCSAKGITNLRGFPEFPNLAELNLSNNSLTSLDGLPTLPNLRTLLLYKNPMESLAGLPRLAPRLNNLMTTLGGEKVDLGDFPEFGMLPELGILSIMSSNVESLDGLAQMPGLVQLSIVESTLSDVSGMPELPALSTLAITRSKLTTLEGLPALPALRQLIVFGNDLQAVTGLAHRDSLRELWLYGNPALSAATHAAELKPLTDNDCVIYWQESDKPQ